MNNVEILQGVILALASSNLFQTHLLTVKIARLKQRISDLRCINGKQCAE